MKRFLVAVSILGLVMATGLTLAGEKEKCSHATQDCLNKMVKNMKNKGLVGVDGEWDEEIGGMVIKSFIEGTQAEAAGVELGDVLIAVNGIPLADKEASYADAAQRTPGAHAKITVLRDGGKHSFKLALMGLNETQIAKYVGMHMVEHHAAVQLADAD
ncbi:MAG: PDZ domain-containing protein [Acidobacteriota bacterium]|nr:MAG: PDZ domain-containing protein [Acidobacteriota bacterium]